MMYWTMEERKEKTDTLNEIENLLIQESKNLLVNPEYTTKKETFIEVIEAIQKKKINYIKMGITILQLKLHL